MDFSARHLYVFVYKLMADEAGGRQNLEKQLEDWAVDEEFREMTLTRSVSWDTADRLALSLLPPGQ